jgi:hypothetical protein
MTGQAQLPGVCWTCCGELMIVAKVLDRHGEPALVPQPCPSCRPRTSSPEAWRAAVHLAKRLVAGAQR